MPVPPVCEAPLLVISPHLDDAVFGTGQLISCVPAVVATVFAGSPGAVVELTSWDERSGFAIGDDVVTRRREEDAAALAVLGAVPRWLPFVDSQYGRGGDRTDIAAEFEVLLDEFCPATVATPLGLFHDDHRVVAAACHDVMVAHPDTAWIAFEDALYRRLPGREITDRVARLEEVGRWSRHVLDDARARERKRLAVECYRSQLRALRASYDRPVLQSIHDPEVVWRLDGR